MCAESEFAEQAGRLRLLILESRLVDRGSCVVQRKPLCLTRGSLNKLHRPMCAVRTVVMTYLGLHSYLPFDSMQVGYGTDGRVRLVRIGRNRTFFQSGSGQCTASSLEGSLNVSEKIIRSKRERPHHQRSPQSSSILG